MRNSAAERGFTLLEVMVALAIFAVLAAAASLAMQHVLQQSHQLRDRLYASWVVDNHLAQMRLLPTPGPGQRTLTIDFAQQRWHLEERRQRVSGMLLVEVRGALAAKGEVLHQANGWLELAHEPH
ncbi:type II secretion system minor pseudopilin GspI [Pseudomonas sp. SAS7]|uniref:type II secretion system minor pseudopilin GspI n=1 Tax=Pseudomonas sp. SAS7 TaxID=3156487 RepID=UPI003F985A81